MMEKNGGAEYVYGLARARISDLEKVIKETRDDLTLLVAATACGKNRVAQRMTRRLHKAMRK